MTELTDSSVNGVILVHVILDSPVMCCNELGGEADLQENRAFAAGTSLHL